MHTLKKLQLILKTLFYFFFWLFLIYGLFLLLDDTQGLIAAVVILITCFLLFCIGLIGLLHSKRPLNSLHSKQEIVSILLIVIITAISTALLSISNYVLHTSLAHELSPRIKNQYYLEALLYEKEFIIERISFLKTLETKTSAQAVIFHEPNDAEFAMEALWHIRKVQSSNEKLIDIHKAVPVTIILYRNPLIFQKHLPHHSYENLHALYVPSEETIHLLVTKQMDEDKKRFLELIGHEYTHHWIVSYLADKGLDNRHLPRWFEEGIAEFSGLNNVRKVPRFVPLNLIPFTRLGTIQDWSYENRKNSSHHPYRQSYYAIDQILRDGKQEKLKVLLLNREQNFYRFFEKEMGESLLEFEARFLRDEMKEYRERK